MSAKVFWVQAVLPALSASTLDPADSSRGEVRPYWERAGSQG
jgi:hypothetical protein